MNSIDHVPGPAMRGYANVTPEQARAAFLARYGAEPERVVVAGCVVLAGPVPR